MKNTIITLASVAALAVSANAQTLSLSGSGLQNGGSIELIRARDGATINVSMTSNGDHPSTGSWGTTGAPGQYTYQLTFDTSLDLAQDLSSWSAISDVADISAGTATISVAGGTATSSSMVLHAGSAAVGVTYNSGTGTASFDATNGTQDYALFTGTGTATTFNMTTAGMPEGGDYYGANFTLNGFTQVPEPSSTALLGLGGLALILRRRK